MIRLDFGNREQSGGGNWEERGKIDQRVENLEGRVTQSKKSRKVSTYKKTTKDLEAQRLVVRAVVEA